MAERYVVRLGVELADLQAVWEYYCQLEHKVCFVLLAERFALLAQKHAYYLLLTGQLNLQIKAFASEDLTNPQH